MVNPSACESNSISNQRSERIGVAEGERPYTQPLEGMVLMKLCEAMELKRPKEKGLDPLNDAVFRFRSLVPIFLHECQ